jgi:hypothetical protein
MSLRSSSEDPNRILARHEDLSDEVRGRSILLAVLVLITVLVLAALPSAARGEDEPKIGISPSKLEFGTVESTKTKSTNIRNHGKADLVVTSINSCSGTSGEFGWIAATPFTVAPKKALKLEVSYTPVDAGVDKGCLEIASDDPKRPIVKLSLRGRAEDDAPPVDGPDIDLKPDFLDFGEVPIGSSATRSVKVKNKGTEPLEGVMVGWCFETSPEFTWDRTDMFSVPPDENVKVAVTYSPTDEGTDEGCLNIVSNDPFENPAVLDLTGTGVDSLAGLVDLDITGFKVKKKFEAGSSDEIFVHLWVRNEGEVNEPRPAVVIGRQGETVVYEETLMVADKPGNKGSNKFAFPSFLPTAAGEILWIAAIDDDDLDLDEAFAVTQVDGVDGPSVDVDLDAVKLKPTKKVSLQRDRSIRLRAWIENRTLDVSDMPGDDAATRYNFPSYTPEFEGDIVWSIAVADDDPDTDKMSAVTKVNP